MGSNMQRQGVPLLRYRSRRSSAPAWKAAWRAIPRRSSSGGTPARWPRSAADQIVVTKDGEAPEDRNAVKTDPENGIYVYKLRKFMRSNSGTCINQKSDRSRATSA
jgi:DNA-directed RNA polymerase subunit beta